MVIALDSKRIGYIGFIYKITYSFVTDDTFHEKLCIIIKLKFNSFSICRMM